MILLIDHQSHIITLFLGPATESESKADENISKEGQSKFTEIVTTNENGVYTIKKNRPHKKNAITWKVRNTTNFKIT